MNDVYRPPETQRVQITGPAGPLEAIAEIPPDNDMAHIGVICHPHPLHGGSMNNKVVHMLGRTMQGLGAPTLRFNFRGVGASAGTFDDGKGETDDALAVIGWARARWAGADLWLAGFSFGGAVALRAAATSNPARLITVAPAVTRIDPASVRMPTCPWLIVQGDLDQLVDAGAVREWAARLSPAPEIAMLSGAEHFFHGRLNDLRTIAADWLKR